MPISRPNLRIDRCSISSRPEVDRYMHSMSLDEVMISPMPPSTLHSSVPRLTPAVCAWTVDGAAAAAVRHGDEDACEFLCHGCSTLFAGARFRRPPLARPAAGNRFELPSRAIGLMPSATAPALPMTFLQCFQPTGACAGRSGTKKPRDSAARLQPRSSILL